ncbi:MAG: hypothetical protein WAQ28_18145 [Bacteroidia bacterium]
MKLLPPLLIVVFISVYIFLRNKYRANKSLTLIKKIKSKKIRPDEIMDGLKFPYAQKPIIEGSKLELIEKKLLEFVGQKIKKEKYLLHFVEKLDSNNIIIIVGAQVSDFVPFGNELMRRNYDFSKLEFHNFILQKDNQNWVLNSDIYSDLRVKLDKEEIARLLFEYIA